MIFDFRICAIVGMVGAVVAFVIGYRLGGIEPKRELAEAQLEHSQQVALWQKLKAQGAADALKRQQALQDEADAARKGLDDARSEILAQASRIAVLSADTGKLRSQLASYASGRPDKDSLASCQSRAAALAELLAEGAGIIISSSNLAREAAIAADERAAEVTALLKAWPQDRAEASRP